MQNYNLKLESEVFKSYRCKRAADSLDIDVEKKSIHEFNVQADLKSPFNIGLIIGASGSGKTTLAKYVFGEKSFQQNVDLNSPIIEQLNKNYSYDQCSELLNGVGLNSVPCWIKPIKTLSNGQKARAEAALLLSEDNVTVKVIDEWTSVVDRLVARAMSVCAEKMIRKTNKQIVFLSCHYDVADWLNPDWIIDCNTQTFIDRRLLCKNKPKLEPLEFQIRSADRRSWSYFSKYHYLSSNLPGGKLHLFGLFKDDLQIGFQCFANYTPPKNKNQFPIYHSNRTVIHPDYCGLGLGLKLINETSKIVKRHEMCEIRAKFSSTPIYKSFIKDKNNWKLLNIERKIGLNSNSKGTMNTKLQSMRHDVTAYVFKYVGAF